VATLTAQLAESESKREELRRQLEEFQETKQLLAEARRQLAESDNKRGELRCQLGEGQEAKRLLEEIYTERMLTRKWLLAESDGEKLIEMLSVKSDQPVDVVVGPT
jgi:hypothetical protein